MKSWMKVMCSVFVLATVAPAAYADGMHSTTGANIDMQNSHGLSPEKMQAMYDDYFQKNYPASGEQGHSASRVNIPSAIAGGEEESVTYRYNGNKNRAFYGVDLPHRSFNNITYPY